jgi:Xaa-Pro dipeptidase
MDSLNSQLVNQSALVSEASMYFEHVEEKLSRFQAILSDTDFDELVIASGETKQQFQDDLFYPFKANPYFREWTPLNKRAGSYLQITKTSKKPCLYLLCSEDIWHTKRQTLPADFERAFDIVEYQNIDEVKEALNADSLLSGDIAVLSEVNTLEVPAESLNSRPLLNRIDYQRCVKTPYEQHCIRQANCLAAPAHKAAREAFMLGASELEIAAAYYRASNTSENEMPYGVIAGVNEHAAVLHHYDLAKQGVTPRSFLIDAGIDYYGYASDITRTYAFNDGCEFADMIRLMDQKQRELVTAGAIGKSPVEIHELCLRKIAEILVDFGLLTISVDKAVETDVINLFMPHGLGHHLGCNVHDKGSQFANAQGDILEASTKYPKLRHTAPMVANQIYTVEPGLYFIPSRLQAYSKSESAGYVQWDKIEQFIPFGGIRIEDNIVLHANGRLENLTRDAFAENF